MKKEALPLLLGLGLAAGCSHVHQRAAFHYEPNVAQPAYEAGGGPRVLVDEAHCNFHRAGGRFAPFARLLAADGFEVGPSTAPFSAASLAGADVLVIANALSREKCDAWKLPTPAAFREVEINALVEWVEAGGSLLLIADHMPFPGAAQELAQAFGLAFIDGYARADVGGPAIRFESAAGTLGEHAVTAGRSSQERVDSVVSFTGQGFRALREVTPILTLPGEVTLFLPRKAGVFEEKTPRFSGEGLLQGVVFRQGAGRVAVFGEAAMFSAQEIVLDDRVLKFGMNAEGAEQNAQFVLNLMHWLAGLLDG